MKIIIDAMGGDHAPSEILKGVALAANECDDTFVLVGNEPVVTEELRALAIPSDRYTVVHAESVIGMEDDPLFAIKKKKDASMVIGLNMLAADEGDAFVSAGNTGALFTGATFLVKRIDGISRAAIGTVMPGKQPCLLLDSGANVTVSPEHLVQFAVMGCAYMQKVYGISQPSVGLLNIGTEDCKGTPLQVETHRKLTSAEGMRYVGNVEANALLFGACNVLVTDGFTGNIVLKTVEGMGAFIMKSVGATVMQSTDGEVKKAFSRLANQFDPAECGGAPILGISRPVIKAHGSSDARAFKNAILQSVRYAESRIIGDLQNAQSLS